MPLGSSTVNISRPHLGSVPYGEIITTCDHPGHIALTFGMFGRFSISGARETELEAGRRG
jgi:hypothetical protein